MANKPQVRFTSKVKRFILDKMAQGHDISQICDKWPDKVPHKDSIYRRSVQDTEFAEEINQAYTVLLMHRLDELHQICGQTAAEAYPHVEDWRQAEAALKRRIDEAKFVLGKMAPILSRRFDKAEKIEVKNSGAPQLAVINYHIPEPKLVQNTPLELENDKND
jgi:hypothetical protein